MLLGRLGKLTVSYVAGATLAMLFLVARAGAQTVVDTPQEANDRIKEMSARAAKSGPHDYIIGNGDLLEFEVFDVKELSREVRVSQTGTIGIPLVPVRLYVAGLTESQAEQKIAEVLEANGLVTNAAVSVTVKDHKSKPITIVGAVAHPMVFQADRQVTLLEVLAEAGGIANDAGDSVLITRPVSTQSQEAAEPPAIGPEDAISNGGSSATTQTANPNSAPVSVNTPRAPVTATSPVSAAVSSSAVPAPTSSPAPPPAPAQPTNTITVNLNDLVEKGDTANNVTLQAGDIVTVPHAGIVYVLGAVGKPGGYVLSNDRSQVTTLKILALAGGTTPTAKSDHAVIIRKNDQGQTQQVDVDLKKVLSRETEDVQLFPSDILYVPNSRTKQAIFRAVEIGIVLGTAIALYRVAY